MPFGSFITNVNRLLNEQQLVVSYDDETLFSVIDLFRSLYYANPLLVNYYAIPHYDVVLLLVNDYIVVLRNETRPILE